ncbi:MAG: DUF2807 domain-containing protein [Bacteroidetes bacterium]|nr:DUF2807 domain-containing protein [Bacteroidota bacterium]
MKKIYFLLIFFATGVMVSAQQVNDPNAVVREAKNFHAIHLTNAFDVYLSQGSEEGVVVSAATEKDRDMIKVEVKDGVLYIGMREGLKWRGNRKLKAYISYKELNELTVSGACDVFLTNTLKSDELLIHQSGASDLKGKIEVAKLTVKLSGASDLNISGHAAQLNVDASGASTFKGYELNADMCYAEASGASDIRITVNSELSAKASGASDIKYKGQGVIRDLRSSGASSVSRG